MTFGRLDARRLSLLGGTDRLGWPVYLIAAAVTRVGIAMNQMRIFPAGLARRLGILALILAPWLGVGAAAAQANTTSAASSVICPISSGVKVGPLPPVHGSGYSSSIQRYQVYLPIVPNQTGC